MFEEIEKANDGREMILAPQNHPALFLSFVWDTTEAVKEDEAEPMPALAVADAE